MPTASGTPSTVSPRRRGATTTGVFLGARATRSPLRTGQSTPSPGDRERAGVRVDEISSAPATRDGRTHDPAGIANASYTPGVPEDRLALRIPKLGQHALLLLTLASTPGLAQFRIAT